MINGYYVTHLYCDYPNCLKHEQFTGQTKGQALQNAIKLDWHVDNNSDSVYCPNHGDENEHNSEA